MTTERRRNSKGTRVSGNATRTLFKGGGKDNSVQLMKEINKMIARNTKKSDDLIENGKKMAINNLTIVNTTKNIANNSGRMDIRKLENLAQNNERISGSIYTKSMNIGDDIIANKSKDIARLSRLADKIPISNLNTLSSVRDQVKEMARNRIAELQKTIEILATHTIQSIQTDMQSVAPDTSFLKDAAAVIDMINIHRLEIASCKKTIADADAEYPDDADFERNQITAEVRARRRGFAKWATIALRGLAVGVKDAVVSHVTNHISTAIAGEVIKAGENVFKNVASKQMPKFSLPAFLRLSAHTVAADVANSDVPPPAAITANSATVPSGNTFKIPEVSSTMLDANTSKIIANNPIAISKVPEFPTISHNENKKEESKQTWFKTFNPFLKKDDGTETPFVDNNTIETIANNGDLIPESMSTNTITSTDEPKKSWTQPFSTFMKKNTDSNIPSADNNTIDTNGDNTSNQPMIEIVPETKSVFKNKSQYKPLKTRNNQSRFEQSQPEQSQPEQSQLNEVLNKNQESKNKQPPKSIPSSISIDDQHIINTGINKIKEADAENKRKESLRTVEYANETKKINTELTKVKKEISDIMNIKDLRGVALRTLQDSERKLKNNPNGINDGKEYVKNADGKIIGVKEWGKTQWGFATLTQRDLNKDDHPESNISKEQLEENVEYAKNALNLVETRLNEYNESPLSYAKDVAKSYIGLQGQKLELMAQKALDDNEHIRNLNEQQQIGVDHAGIVALDKQMKKNDKDYYSLYNMVWGWKPNKNKDTGTVLSESRKRANDVLYNSPEYRDFERDVNNANAEYYLDNRQYGGSAAAADTETTTNVVASNIETILTDTTERTPEQLAEMVNKTPDNPNNFISLAASTAQYVALMTSFGKLASHIYNASSASNSRETAIDNAAKYSSKIIANLANNIIKMLTADYRTNAPTGSNPGQAIKKFSQQIKTDATAAMKMFNDVADTFINETTVNFTNVKHTLDEIVSVAVSQIKGGALMRAIQKMANTMQSIRRANSYLSQGINDEKYDRLIHDTMRHVQSSAPSGMNGGNRFDESYTARGTMAEMQHDIEAMSYANSHHNNPVVSAQTAFARQEAQKVITLLQNIIRDYGVGGRLAGGKRQIRRNVSHRKRPVSTRRHNAAPRRHTSRRHPYRPIFTRRV